MGQVISTLLLIINTFVITAQTFETDMLVATSRIIALDYPGSHFLVPHWTDRIATLWQFSMQYTKCW